MSLNRYEFELLAYLEREEKREYSVRELSDELTISAEEIIRSMETLEGRNLLRIHEGKFDLTAQAYEELEPYRVKKAVILAAGFGSRMMPATEDRPKPMVKVNGTRIIDSLLDSLVAVGIRDITIVGGYRYGKLCELLEKYSFIHLIENKEYSTTNNISSAIACLDRLCGGLYLCEADLLISNPKIITKYQYASNILGSYSMQTDDWSFKMADGFLEEYKKGGVYCYNYYGISYWTEEDCCKLREDFAQVYGEYEDGKNYFWEFIPFVLKKDRYRVEVRPCRKQDIIEIDNYYELQQLDSSYNEDEKY
ncbi:MAG: NTP transferase domain-containing protein [Oscillospiraceae bacterium]|nr:NTP transferase domain-containing protein [Oscillospiraceae bacterium]